MGAPAAAIAAGSFYRPAGAARIIGPAPKKSDGPGRPGQPASAGAGRHSWMAARVGEVSDLWHALGDDRQPLHGALAALDGLLSEHDWSEAWAASTRRPVSRRAKPRP